MKRRWLGVVLSAGALTLVGCGGSTSSAGSTGSATANAAGSASAGKPDLTVWAAASL
jgi:hypothetical protein